MARNIFIVNAKQVVTSQSHPEGIYSDIADYPKTFDSRNYEATEANPNGNADIAFVVAQADYFGRVAALAQAKNRAMWTVTLESADGRMLQHKSSGAFPDMTPEPEEEPEAAE